MTLGEILTLAFSAVLVENIILSRFLGTCPFLGVSSKQESAVGMGLAVIFVITLSSVISWTLFEFILAPFAMGYMATIVFILVIASLVQIIEMFLKKVVPSLYKSMGIYLPLITTNCGVLGMAKIVATPEYNLLTSFVMSFASSVGFLLVIYIFSSLREKIDNGPVPLPFKGVPIALIMAGLMAMIFAKFVGVI
ncbi:MAG TPA: RnfABCDGE type electron transport complex subunit A [Bacilli bacterium]|nr:MAG: Electron transport complex protein RnfA [Tenericutes bacterium ADurb.BinA124]HNZ50893.1 RnfABCDGE type electron transport complex subunit A [Bacilli bacterium]HPN61043.1 RnfABCDGE type electron transport complex subunit A [Bacilli bacterium]HPX84665.1 RnfABCDGE type electron transport complex subunit A [Bacilli bacterium]HQC74514.1 RnfABCDGE type electron transport complex subunit A [Bacilli bacterium]